MNANEAIKTLRAMQHERDWWEMVATCRYYPTNQPEYVPCTVRLDETVRGDGPFAGRHRDAGIYTVWCNAYGAMSIIATDGQMLGLRPHDVAEYLTWERNPYFAADAARAGKDGTR